jgi:serralysin
MATVASAGDSGNVLIDSLVAGTRWQSAVPKTVITVGFSTDGGAQPTWQEMRAMQAIFASFEAIINVDIQFVGNSAEHQADIVFKFQNNTNSTYYGTGDTPQDGQASFVTIQRDNYKGGSDSNITAGSFDYFILLHEFSHALGLSHPHRDGEGDQSLAFPGLETSYRDLGDYSLNQTAFTAMSYNFGWKSAPADHTPSSKSNAAGPMAIDIAALQYIYGANTTAAAGNTVYQLATQVSAKALIAIWDLGGRDTISAAGLGPSHIDLRAATVALDEGGGGFMSYVLDQPGGFTIARGVVIENAIGGSFNDVLAGNAARNILTGNNGRDVLYGRGGKDVFDFNKWTDSNGAELDVIKDFAAGDRIDVSSMDASWVRSLVQDFAFKGRVARFNDDGQIRYSYAGDDTIILLNFDTDQTSEMIIRLTGRHVLDRYDFIF